MTATKDDKANANQKMYQLFMQVLKNRDLSRAGDLFSLPDSIIASDLANALNEITIIISQADYINNNNDQSVVEIYVTRVTSCIRDTGSVEEHCVALINLLEVCLKHNLEQTTSEDDPPHAKISSDIISCIFLNYSKKSIMEQALPTAIKFLYKGNRELSRNMASYLALAAMEFANLLTPHVQQIIDSIKSGNYSLVKVLSNIYQVSPEAFQNYGISVVSLLPHCDSQEKLSLLSLFLLIAKDDPSLIESSIPHLVDCLSGSQTVALTLEIFLHISEKMPTLLNANHINAIKQSIEKHPQCVCLAAQIISAVGKLSKDQAQDALNFVLEKLQKADRGSQSTLLREATLLCSSYPILFTDKVLAGVRQRHTTSTNQITSGGVTIVKVGGSGGYNRRTKLGDSRSTGRLQQGQTHRSMTKLNVSTGLHKSMSRLSSSQQINATSNNNVVTKYTTNNNTNKPISSGGVTVTTCIPPPPRIQRPLSQGPLILNHQQHQITVVPTTIPLNSITVYSGQVSVLTNNSIGSSLILDSNPPQMIAPPVVSRRHNNTTITLLNSTQQNSTLASQQRMSVFEPYPMRDTIQHFCEKHLESIKTYMEKVSIRIPSPAKCTIEEKRQKKSAKLHFACQAGGEHCLYSKTYFTMRTRNPRIWIHLMFISLQARHTHALSSRDTQVASLKHCWDILKCETKSFLTLVTSAFPCPKDQETLISELRHSGYFDLFQICPLIGSVDQLIHDTQLFYHKWGCFLCAHPERAVGFLRGDAQPVIEGQLKEKKGKWRLFRRWRTRYFTLSGAHLSCKGSSGGESIDINQIRSVKVSRGARNIPKAFEIFTENQTLILKPKDGKNAEEWVQCLSIVVAHSHAKEIPGKSNSLPARGISSSRNAI